MIVICLEGPHGGGKTGLLEKFEEQGFSCLDEGFLDMPNFAGLHPQSVTMENAWVNAWFQRLLNKVHEGGENQIIVTDRSPFSAVFYTENGQGAMFDPIIRAQIRELAKVGIEIYTVYLKVDAEILWKRITQRLQLEPERRAYKEDQREWMDAVKLFYDSYNWDFVVENSLNNVDALNNVMQQVINSVCSHSPKFTSLLNKKQFLVDNRMPILIMNDKENDVITNWMY